MDIDALRAAIDPAWRPWLLGLVAVLLGAAVLEGLVLSWRRPGSYDWRASACSLADAVGRRAVDALGLSLAAPLLWWVYAHRVDTITLNNGGTLLVLFIGEELCYYAYHRASHRVRWLWANHAVHHSPNQLTLATALRLGWTGKLTGGALLFAPLVWLGFAPQAVLAALALNLLYQFWVHAAWIPKLGPIEWIFNTPSHHRVHHASNAEYLDCNYGGVLIVFDRLFGSFVAERDDVAIRYGLTTPLHSHNPVRIALHGWWALASDLRAARGVGAVLRTLCGPPPALAPSEEAVAHTRDGV
jgi:sterol desaturase/sphingolipid hydroxylase (fatty acid hydroxylase superfamily)